MLEFKSKILSIENLAADIFVMGLSTPAGFDPIAGQFVNIRILQDSNFILRRPISIFETTPGVLRIIFKVRGKGTTVLSEMKPGMEVDILGPLGTGFDLKDSKNFVLVSGGVGFPPVYCLAKHIKALGKQENTYIFCGSASDEYKPLYGKLEDMGFKVNATSDDGSIGTKGLVTQIMPDVIDGLAPEHTGVFTCGPEPMLKAVARLALDRGFACQVSLESFMGCGVGACLCCVVENSDEDYVRVCADGPVFDINNINMQEKWTQI